MALTHHQKRVIFHILSVGDKKHASRKEELDALVVGLHESGLRNLKYGDRDSRGWRQERAMYYKNPNNVRAAAGRFFDEARPFRGRHLSIGALAQAIQQSGTPHAFERPELLKQAKDILAAWNHGKLGRHGGAGGSGGSVLSVSGVREPRFIQGATKTDTTRALLDSLIAGGTGKRHASLAHDLVRRLDSGAYTTTTPDRVDPGKVRTKRIQLPGASPDVAGGKGYKHGVGPHGTPNLLIQIGHLAQQMGLSVGENPNFGAVSGGHQPHSYHFKNEAIDISSPNARLMAKFARIVQRRYGHHLAELIHNSPFGAYAIKHGQKVDGPSFYSKVWAGHRNHVHVAVGRGDHGRN